MPKDLPDDPALLKQLLEQMLIERESNKGRIVHPEGEIALLRQRLFGRKSGQTADLATPQPPFSTRRKASPSLSTKALKKRLSFRPSVAVNASRYLPTCHVSKSSTNFLSMN